MDSNKNGDDSDDMTKPKLHTEDVADILRELYGFEGGFIKGMNGYDDLNYHYSNPETVNNPHIQTVWPHGYVLKVINSKDSKKVEFHKAQNDLMIFLNKRNIRCSKPIKNKSGEYISVENLPLSSRDNVKKSTHVVKMLEFQPGTLLKNVKSDFSLYFKIGQYAAKLNKAAEAFHHNGYERNESIWHLHAIPKVLSHTNVVKSPSVRASMEQVLEDFIHLDNRMDANDKQVIHGDLNNQNILCELENDEWTISSIIDFGDSHMSYPLYDLAICMFYTILDCKQKGLDYVIGSGHTLAGYRMVDSAFDIDYVTLQQCITARLCQSYVMGLYTMTFQPDNSYIADGLDVYPEILVNLNETPISDLKDIWENILRSYVNKTIIV